MFREETVFILGAGASFWCGYPLGDGLITQIINDMNDEIYIPVPKEYYQKPEAHQNVNILNWINENDSFQREAELFLKKSYVYPDEGFINLSANYIRKVKILDIPEFQNLSQALYERPHGSIDAFLRDNRSFQKEGKAMIVYSLLKKENKRIFENQPGVDDWYRYLFNDLTIRCNRPEDILSNKLKILTFNYDVSLDSYLANLLLKTERFSSIAKEFLEEKLEIIHVYGDVNQGTYETSYGCFYEEERKSSPHWMEMIEQDRKLDSKTGKNTSRFLKSLDLHEGIKTMYEERNGETREELIENNRKILSDAKDILIIGFGFDEDNLAQLGFPEDRGEWGDFLSGKTIKWHNYKGEKTNLSQRLKDLHGKSIQLIDPTTADIASAYRNEFK